MLQTKVATTSGKAILAVLFGTSLEFETDCRDLSACDRGDASNMCVNLGMDFFVAVQS